MRDDVVSGNAKRLSSSDAFADLLNGIKASFSDLDLSNSLILFSMYDFHSTNIIRKEGAISVKYHEIITILLIRSLREFVSILIWYTKSNISDTPLMIIEIPITKV
jgi:hypothetical protein